MFFLRIGLMEDRFIFRGKVPDDKHILKIWLNGNIGTYLNVI